MKRIPVMAVSLAAAALFWATSPPAVVAQEQDKPAERALIRSAPATAAPAARPAPAASSRLAAPATGPLDHICNSGNCACAGAEDCVNMKDICAPGTLGCNQHGCTCKEAEGDDGG